MYSKHFQNAQRTSGCGEDADSQMSLRVNFAVPFNLQLHRRNNRADPTAPELAREVYRPWRR